MQITEARIKELINEALEPFEAELKEDIRIERRVEMQENIVEGFKKELDKSLESGDITSGVIKNLTDVNKVDLADDIGEYIRPRGSSRILEHKIKFHPVNEGTVEVTHDLGKKPTGLIVTAGNPNSRPRIISADKNKIVLKTEMRGQEIEAFLIAEDEE